MKISANNSSVNLDAYLDNKIDAKQANDVKNSKYLNENLIPKGTDTDTVSLSSKAKVVQEAKQVLNSLPDIDENAVAQFKEAIENGTYQVDGKKVAFKIIEEALLSQWV